MYLDSAILIKLVVREPDSDFHADLLDGQHRVRSSELAVAECRSALLRKRVNGEIDALTCDQAWNRLQLFWSPGGGLVLDPVTLVILQEAGEMMVRCADRVAVRTLDAIHLASCASVRAYPLITNDRIMRNAADVFSIPLNPLPDGSV